MKRASEGSVERGFREGLRQLARHRPDKAVRLFREAVDACPASETGLLSFRLYWLALALLRLDKAELGLKSLASAQKLRPRGLARKAYAARINEYGMLRRPSGELDDFYAFYSIQLCAYLGRRPGGRFASHEEKDLATRLVAEAWLGLKKSGRLPGAGTSAKLRLFQTWPVAFPGLLGSSRAGTGLRGKDDGAFRQAPGLAGIKAWDEGSSEAACPDVTEVDFRRSRVMSADDRCRCGSGLPFARCCGRTTGLGEL